MRIVPHQIDQALGLLWEGRFEDLGKRLVRTLHQRWLSYGLRKDITQPFSIPTARIPLAVRELEAADIPLLLPEETSSLDRKEQQEIAIRRKHLAAKIPRCYVAVDLRSNTPCFIQWLMGPQHNDQIQKIFHGRFPVLGDGEALLEDAYTPVRYRGKGIMPTAMAMIAGRAIELGCHSVITFVAHDNTPSLKACRKAGFVPYLTRRDSRTFFQLWGTRSFESLAEGFSLPFEKSGSIVASANER